MWRIWRDMSIISRLPEEWLKGERLEALDYGTVLYWRLINCYSYQQSNLSSNDDPGKACAQ